MSTLAINIPVPVSGDGTIVDVSSIVGPKTVLLSGLFSGAYTLLASQDDANFVPLLQFDAGGVAGIEQTVPGSVKSVRLRAGISAVPVGTVTCSVSGIVGSGAGTNSYTTVATLASGFRGTTPAIDTHTVFPPSGVEETICFLCRGLFQGQVTVEGSNDNVNWNPIGAFQAPFIPTDLLGLSNVLEFAPLDTADKTRYVRLNVLGATTGAVVVTMGGLLVATPVIPSTPPAPGQILIGNEGGTAYAPKTLSGGATMDKDGVVTVTNVQQSGVTSTATAGGTTTLTSASSQTQEFTGILDQTAVLPDATTIPFVGWAYRFVNSSTGTITVQANGGGAVATVSPGWSVRFKCTSIATAPGTWMVETIPLATADAAGAESVAHFNKIEALSVSWLDEIASLAPSLVPGITVVRPFDLGAITAGVANWNDGGLDGGSVFPTAGAANIAGWPLVANMKTSKWLLAFKVILPAPVVGKNAFVGLGNAWTKFVLLASSYDSSVDARTKAVLRLNNGTTQDTPCSNVVDGLEHEYILCNTGTAVDVYCDRTLVLHHTDLTQSPTLAGSFHTYQSTAGFNMITRGLAAFGSVL